MGRDVRQETLHTASEAELIARAIARDETAIRTLLRANNRRLYRIARSIVRDDGEAEDVLQESYLKAFAALPSFRQGSSFATWLTRIVLNEAMQHVRRRRARTSPPWTADVIPFPLNSTQSADPEQHMVQSEICRFLERAIDDLPDDFRVVLVARTLEGLSVEETAALLDIRPETVKTRLHRARAQLRSAVAEHIGSAFEDVFPFDGARCERFSNAVIAKMRDAN